MRRTFLGCFMRWQPRTMALCCTPPSQRAQARQSRPACLQPESSHTHACKFCAGGQYILETLPSHPTTHKDAFNQICPILHAAGHAWNWKHVPEAAFAAAPPPQPIHNAPSGASHGGARSPIQWRGCDRRRRSNVAQDGAGRQSRLNRLYFCCSRNPP